MTEGVAAVVLAAGASTRLGRPKQLLLHEGIPLVRRAALSARDSGVDETVVVVGANAEQVVEAVGELPRVHFVLNPEWRSGIASSIAAGLAAVTLGRPDGVRRGALLMLADQPRVDAAALRRMLDAFDGPDRIVAASYAGTLGTPAIFGRHQFWVLLGLEGDRGAGGWLRANAASVRAVPLPEAAFDVDTAADAKRLLDRGVGEGP